MSDLVKRLYDESIRWEGGSPQGLLVAAGDAIARLERELGVARKGLEAVASLIAESHGVCGLHLNGDVAPWTELCTGGRFEEWLVAFDDALVAVRGSNTRLSGEG